MHRDFGRATRRILRQLANTAWERELNAELTALAASFAEWKTGGLGPHELSDRIHTFHYGAARDLYGLYTRVRPPELVARAVGLGIVSEDEVPPDLREALANGIQYYRSESEAPLDDSDSESSE